MERLTANELHELAVRAKTRPDAKYQLLKRMEDYVEAAVRGKLEATGLEKSNRFIEDAKRFAISRVAKELGSFDLSKYRFQTLVSNASAWGAYLALQAESGVKKHDFDKYRSALKKRDHLAIKLKREPTVSEIARELGTSETEVEWRLSLPQFFQGKEMDYYDPAAHKILESVPELEDARKVLEILSEREKFVFKRKVMDGAQFNEIAEYIQISENVKLDVSAVQSIFTNAQKKLRAEAARRDFEDTAPDLHAMAIRAQSDPKAAGPLKKAIEPFATSWAERFVDEKAPNAKERRPFLVSVLADHGIAKVMKELPRYDLKFRDFDFLAQETAEEAFASAARKILSKTSAKPAIQAREQKPEARPAVKPAPTPLKPYRKLLQRIEDEGKPPWVPLDEDISHHAKEWLMSYKGSTNVSAEEKEAFAQAGKQALLEAVRKGNAPASERYPHEHAFNILRKTYEEKAKAENK